MKFRIFTFLLLVANFCSAFSADRPIPVSQLGYYKTPSRPGWEERGPEWIKWLSPDVRFSNASGTICYYDPETQYAYVITAGHLFSDKSLSYADSQKTHPTRWVEVFYHNKEKLQTPKRYLAEILCYQNFKESVFDVALCRFKADWVPDWTANIAPADYQLEKGKMYHSTGCDGLSEPAHYLVEYLREDPKANVSEIVTQQNNPRGGRSGGGVMTDDGQLIFICSRGDGLAFWTSLKQIHRLLKEEGFEFIAQSNFFRKIPINDRANPKATFPDNYIPAL